MYPGGSADAALSRSRSSAPPAGSGTSSSTAARSTSAPTATRRSAATTTSWPGATSRTASTGDAVSRVLDAFLDWCQKHHAARTYDWYRDYLQSFARSIPRDLAVARAEADPRPAVGRRPARLGHRQAGRDHAVQRAFNWAAKMGLIEANPVRHVEKPRAGRRDVVITPEEYAWILGQVRDEQFRDLLVVCWETGCRPQEVLAVEARHVDLDGGRWVFPARRGQGEEGTTGSST